MYIYIYFVNVEKTCTCGWFSSLAPPHCVLLIFPLFLSVIFCWWGPSSSPCSQSHTPRLHCHLQRHHQTRHLSIENMLHFISFANQRAQIIKVTISGFCPTYLSWIAWFLLFLPIIAELWVFVRKRQEYQMKTKMFRTYLVTAGTELSLGSSFKRSWLLLLFPFSV